MHPGNFGIHHGVRWDVSWLCTRRVFVALWRSLAQAMATSESTELVLHRFALENCACKSR